MGQQNLFQKRIYRKENVNELSYHDIHGSLQQIPHGFYHLSAYEETTAWGDWNITRTEENSPNYLSIHYITSGRCLFRQGKEEKILREGELFLCIPQARLSCCSGEKFKKRSLSVHYESSELFYSLDPDRIVKCGSEDPEYIQKTFDEVKKTIIGAKPHQHCETSAQIYKLIYLLIGSSNKSDSVACNWMARSIRLSPHLYSSLKQLKNEFQLSRPAMTKFFRTTYNTTPMGFVILMRFEKSMWFLKNEVPPIYKVAELCGFRNVPFFMREFKKRYGMTPLQYRKQMLGKKDHMVSDI